MNRFDFVSNQFVDGYITGLMNKEMKDPNLFAEGGSLGDENYKYSNPFEYGQKLAMAHKFGTGSDSSNPFNERSVYDVYQEPELPNQKPLDMDPDHPYLDNRRFDREWPMRKYSFEENLPPVIKPLSPPVNISTDIRSI